MKLHKEPVRPAWKPVYADGMNRVKSWSKFISEAYWIVELEDQCMFLCGRYKRPHALFFIVKNCYFPFFLACDKNNSSLPIAEYLPTIFTELHFFGVCFEEEQFRWSPMRLFH